MNGHEPLSPAMIASAAVPTLDAIAARPELVTSLPGQALLDLSIQAQAVLMACTRALIMAPVAAVRGHDEVLDVAQAARRLGIATKTLQDRARKDYKELLIDNGTRRLAFSSARIEAFKHAGSAAPVPAGQARVGSKRAPSRPAQLPPELAYRRQGGGVKVNGSDALTVERPRIRHRGMGRTFARPKGSGNWWIAYYYRGQEIRESVRKTLGKLHITRQEAGQLLKSRIGEIAGGRFTGLEHERLTVGELVRSYIAHLQLKGAKSIAPVKSEAQHLYLEFNDVKAMDLRPAMIQDWMQRCLTAGKARGTVAQRAARLRAALSLAHKQGRILAMPYVPTIAVNNVRQGFLAPEDFESFVAQLPAPIDDIARFAYLTGWRRSEVLGLQWVNVDFRAGEVRLGDTKNGQGRVVPMFWQDEHGQRHLLAFAQVLEKRRRVRALTPWVFHRDGKPVGRFEGPWRKAARAAGLPYMGCPECPMMPPSAPKLAAHRVEHHGAPQEAALALAQQIKKASQILHDFRRSAVKNMLDAGVPEKVAMLVTGHRSWSTFQRYNIRSSRDVALGLRQTELYVQQAAKADTSRTVVALAKPK